MAPYDVLPRLFPDSSYLSNLFVDLHNLGLYYTLKTPLLIVCGKKSSGKSSVLEAITHIPFPINNTTGTPFTVEVAFRRGQISAINVSIEPGLSRVNKQTSQRVREFKPTFSSLDELPSLIEQAKVWLGIDASDPSLTDDVLKIELVDPSNLDITIVDLPGLCDSNGDNGDGIPIAYGLGERYMKNPRYIIFPLLVFTCGKGTLTEALRFVDTPDPTRKRTTSVISKADLLPKSDDPSKFFPLTNPETLVPHALVNRSAEKARATHDERDELEKRFFGVAK
ncbi:dynamin GTPase [Aspergillus sclerotialis]|uniref:Dynamin GTPase n=1 Tax=Aspergillus sclerotialis TaxID=2070753 RepID=A0A3A3A0W3_9EURO|nr:dynamin GTPase [Aspergillus sclerotialis]